jgi:hypothetical protein
MSSCWEDGLRWRRSDRPRRAAAATTTACDWPLCAAAAPSPHPLPRRRREAAQRGQAARARPAARAAVRHSRSNGGSPALGGHRRDASLLCSRNVMRGTEEGARPAHCSPASLAPHRTSPSRGHRLPCPGTATACRVRHQTSIPPGGCGIPPSPCGASEGGSSAHRTVKPQACGRDLDLEAKLGTLDRRCDVDVRQRQE